jgi:hypothetical protein
MMATPTFSIDAQAAHTAIAKQPSVEMALNGFSMAELKYVMMAIRLTEMAVTETAHAAVAVMAL